MPAPVTTTTQTPTSPGSTGRSGAQPGPGAPSARRAAGRPRDDAIEPAVLDAAAGLLRDSGVHGCSIEAVSRRCGIGKPTIYRRWPNRTALAIDAFARRLAVEVPLIDTGDAAADLAGNFVQLAEHYSGPDGRVLAELLAAAVLEPGAARLLQDQFFAARRAQLTALWRRGVDRGQLRADLDPGDAIDLLFGAGILRLLLGHPDVDVPSARRLARAALHGLVDHADAASTRGPAHVSADLTRST